MADEEKVKRQRALLPVDGPAAQSELLYPVSVQHSTSRTAGNDHERAQYAAHKMNTGIESDRAKDKMPPMRGAMDLERVRVKLEAARTRLVGPFSDIPTGREYDSPPDDTEEEAYDALEKAYNAAFMVPAPDTAENSEHTKREAAHSFHFDARLRALPKENIAPQHLSTDRFQAETAVGAGQTIHKTVVPRLKEELEAGKGVQEAERARQVGTLKSLCLSTLKQQATGAHQAESQQADMSQSEAKSYASSKKKNTDDSSQPPTDSVAGSSTPADSMKSPRDVVMEGDNDLSSAVATASPASMSSTEVMSATSSVLPSPKATSMEKSRDISPVSTPEVKEPPRADLVTMTLSASRHVGVVDDDQRALNEFLIAELQIYCSELLHREFEREGPSDASDAARITAHQLFRDHQRALVDFDAEWNRSHSDSYQAYLPSNVEESPSLAQTSVDCNPFQQYSTGLETPSEWTTLLRQVKVSSARPDWQVAMGMPQEWHGQEDCSQLFATHKSGLNGVIVGADRGESERHQIAAFMAQMATSQNASAFHVVVSASADLKRWEKALASQSQIQLYPYWGGKGDRNNLLQLLSNGYFSDRSASAHVLLTSYEVFVEDIATLSSLQCQLSVTDIPSPGSEQVAPIWPHLLSLRCRQRLLFCQREFKVDARKLLHFLVPDVFDSRRKFLAWNCAAFRTDQIRAICDVVKAFILISDGEVVNSFIEKVASLTEEKSRHERKTLDVLNQQLMLKPVHPEITASVKRLVKEENKLNLSALKAMDGTDDSQLSTPSLKKRRNSDGMSRSRQRISRCGKCAGCLAEDCLVCDHCQDMKKYGGPGLRKQSCKNRKCSNPKTWGLARRKRKRGKGADVGADPEEAEDVDSLKDYSELDDGTVTYSTVESDGDSVYTASLSNAGAVDSDSEAAGSSHLSDATLDSPRARLLADRASLDLVMRCGKCMGCRAPDCTKCRYCLDMSKHGGPGVRNQSCKDRKCIAPRIVKRSMDSEGQYVDEQGHVVGSGASGEELPSLYKAPDSSDSPAYWGVVTATPRTGDRSAMLTLSQECELFVEPRLVFVCKHCVARLSSKALLDFHNRVEHPDRAATAVTALEREASRLFMHPICQNAMISVQLKQQDRSQRSSPLGYAKLEGREFEYFLLQPYVVLGRMDSCWRALYKRLGFRDLKGLPGGQVDCHVGNDGRIATMHAVISWDARVGSFVITCLSLRCAISVNGRLLSSSSPPVALGSRNLVQIGSSTFYFLLPKTATDDAKGVVVADELAMHTPARGEAIPREEVRAWMQAAVQKRRHAAKQQQVE